MDAKQTASSFGYGGKGRVAALAVAYRFSTPFKRARGDGLTDGLSLSLSLSQKLISPSATLVEGKPFPSQVDKRTVGYPNDESRPQSQSISKESAMIGF